MHDRDVRLAVLARLQATFPDPMQHRVVEEMAVWSNSARIDVAVVGTDLYGIEIKSASDTLKRLDQQVDLFGRVFDRIDLAVARCHMEKALLRIPDWWGVIQVEMDLGGAVMTPFRAGCLNPSPDLLLVSALLWRNEAIDLLDRLGLARGWRSKTKPALDRRLCEHLTRSELTGHVCRILRSRTTWRVDPAEMRAS